MNQQWLKINGYERYLVSSDGVVKSLCGHNSERILKPRENDKGYLYVQLCRKGEPPKNFSVHGLVALGFLGPKSEGIEINHKNGFKKDNRCENLEYTTRSGNVKHAYENGLRKPVCFNGEENSVSKLTNFRVKAIRRLYATGKVTQQKIAEMAGIDQGNVSSICLRKTWKHI